MKITIIRSRYTVKFRYIFFDEVRLDLLDMDTIGLNNDDFQVSSRKEYEKKSQMVRNNNIGVFMNEKQIDKLLDSLDSIAQSLRTVEDTILELDSVKHQERVEWYYYEFYNLLKSKNRGKSKQTTEKE